MGTLWPQSGIIVRDNNDARAIGAKAYFYDAGTTTPKVVFQDEAESTPATNPVLSDAYGRWPATYIPYGTYKVVITTSAGAAIGSTIDNILNTAPFNDSFTLDATTILTTGDVFFSVANTSRTGCVRLNGRTIGNASSTGTERANADCADLFAFIWNNVANGQAAVSTGRGATAAADFAANKTIALPDARGTGPVGFDQMGGTDAALLASAPVVSGSTILAGSILGANTQTLTTANLASHTHTGTTGAGSAHSHSISITSGTESANHAHTGTTDGISANHTHGSVVTGGGANTFAAGGLTGINSLTTGSSGVQSADHTHTFTSGTQSANHNHLVSGTSATEGAHTHTFTSDANGSGTAHNNLARSLTVTWFIKL